LRIIVTGGAGFIGSHVAHAYVEAGHDVVVVDSLWPKGGGRREYIPERANFVHMDIREPELARVVREFSPQIISHHAAQHSVAIGSRDPTLDAEVNILGLLNVLEAAVKANVRKIVFAGSGATYGDPERLPITEATPQRPTSPYGISKMVAEHYFRFFKAEHGLDFTVLRYANVYGPRQDPSGEAGVIAIFANRFLAGQGVRIDGDGGQTRDYVYVGDIAQLNLRALELGDGNMYVIGTGKRTSVNEIYECLVEVTGIRAAAEHGPKRPGDVRDAEFDSTLARRELGWQATTGLHAGIERTVEFFRTRVAA